MSRSISQPEHLSAGAFPEAAEPLLASILQSTSSRLREVEEVPSKGGSHEQEPAGRIPVHGRPRSRPLGDPRSWEHWIEHYEGKSYRVLAPAYPGLEVEAEPLNEDPSPMAALTIPGVVEHYEDLIAELEKPPILMDHSMGGLIVQILPDHGYGAAGVVIDSAPAEGIRVTPVAQIRSLFPFLKNPANRHRAVGFTKEQFHNAFANTLSREESDEAYERYHIPAPGNFVWAAVLATFEVVHLRGWPPGWIRRLRQRRARTAAPDDGRGGPRRAGLGRRVQLQALPQLQCSDRLPRVSGTLALHGWSGWLGRCSRLRPGVGLRACHRPPGSLSGESALITELPRSEVLESPHSHGPMWYASRPGWGASRS